MAVSAYIKDVDNIILDSLLNSKETHKIEAYIIYSGEGDDKPIPGINKFTFNFTANTMGNLKPANGGSYDVDIFESPKDSNTFIATIEVVGTAYGICKVTGVKTGSVDWNATPKNINITAANEIPIIVEEPQNALKTSNVIGKPDDPNNLATKITVLVEDKDNNPIPETNVIFTIMNVRTDEAKQTGAFYDNLKTLKKLNSLQPDESISDSILTQRTDSDGKSTLYIGTNNNTGFLNINVSTQSVNGNNYYIYIYDSARGVEMNAPITKIGPDLSDYNENTFTVTVSNYNVEEDEYIGVFLNDLYVTQIQGKYIKKNNNKYNIEVDTDSLIIGDKNNTENNNVFYARRTSNGDLVNSKKFEFIANGPIPEPLPTNVILDYMLNPDGGVINIGSIYVDDEATDFITTIDLQKASSTLFDMNKYTLKSGDIITVYATFQGDYVANDLYQSNFFKYKQVVTNPQDDNFHIAIPAEDIIGYGVAKEKGKTNSYSMYYDVTPLDQKKSIASSKTVRGVLSTRKI